MTFTEKPGKSLPIYTGLKNRSWVVHLWGVLKTVK